MRCKIVAVLIVSVVMSFVCGRMLFAQYTGGNGDGYAMGSFSGTYYTGGSYDGYARGSFTGTLYDRPSVTTGSATSVTTSSAILNGTVSTNGTTTTALFQYGIASGTYTGTSTQTTITGSSTSAVSSTVSSLSADTIYYYRIAANNSSGTSTGSEASFTTTASPGGGGDGGGGGGGTKYTLTVISASPSNGATGVGANTAVSVTFSLLMNGSTLTTEAFKLSSDVGSATGSVSTDYYKAIFTPASSLSYDTTYTAVITTKAQAANAAGTTLDSNYSWSFTTEIAPVVPTPTTTSTVTPAFIPSPTPVASPTPAITPTPPAGLSLSKEVAYLSGDTVAITVVDADRETNPTSEDTLTTALKVTALNYYAGGDLTLDLKENAVNSGTFLATIKTGTTTTGGANSGTRSNIGTIKTVQGGTATVVYTDTAPNASTITKTLSFSSSDATVAFDAESYTVGSYAVVTHVDAEENEDATKVDILLEHAYIETSSFNRAKIRFVETGVDTGAFKGSIRIISGATLDYDRIQANGGDTLTAWCEDKINTTGAPRVVSASGLVTGSGTPTPTVTPVATLTPLPSIAPTPSPVECTARKMALSSGKLNPKKNESSEVTVSVMGTNGCPVEGKQVTAKVSKGSKLVSVSPASQETDEDGKAVFTVKAKKKTGSARVTFHVEEFKKSVSVTVKK